MSQSCSSTGSNVAGRLGVDMAKRNANEKITILNDDVIEDEEINLFEGNEVIDADNVCAKGKDLVPNVSGNGNEVIDANNIQSCADETNLVPNVSSEYVPYVGKEFDSVEEAHEFYNTYAMLSGFDTCIRDSKKKRGVIYYKQFSCKKNGFKKQKGTEKGEYVSIKCGCKAWMSVELDSKKNKWHVRNVQYAHNHCLHASLKVDFHKLAEKMNIPQKSAVDAMLGSEHLQNNVNRYHRKDCQAIFNYFKKKRDENPDFYYNIQVNEMGQVGNCFWVDAIAREDYYYFGDVVLFDTAYKRSKDHMSFALFNGVNHHKQNIVFGCALLVDDKKETFKWLFEEWLYSMGSQAPVLFLIGQDLTIKAAVKEAFPNTMHKCCNWNILTKVPTYVSDLYKDNQQFKYLWDMWFFKSETIEEFESRWNEMINLYRQLETIEWATNLWKERKTWAKPYFSNIFMAGVSTTQRSKSINNYFKHWVDSRTCLSDFFVKYEETIDEQRDNAKKLDLKMNNEVEPTNSPHPLEVHMRDTFTPNMFKKHFKQEFLATLGCSYRLKEHVGEVREYSIKQLLEDYCTNSSVYNYKDYLISFDYSRQCLSSCQCKLWESMGVVCCHMLIVLKAEQILKLPPTYILKRWTKHAKKGVVEECSTSQRLTDSKTSLLIKKKVLHLKANMCINEALSDDECYEDTIDVFDELLEHLRNVKIKTKRVGKHSCNEGSDMNVLHNATEDQHDDVILANSTPVRTNENAKQIISNIRQSRLQRCCTTCGRQGHDSHICCLSKNTSTDGGVAICHSCEGMGHDKKDCPKLKQAGCTSTKNQ